MFKAPDISNGVSTCSRTKMEENSFRYTKFFSSGYMQHHKPIPIL